MGSARFHCATLLSSTFSIIETYSKKNVYFCWSLAIPIFIILALDVNQHDWHGFVLKLLLIRFLSDSRSICWFIFNNIYKVESWSIYSFAEIFLSLYPYSTAWTGNQTRDAHVTSEHSTTEPSMRYCSSLLCTEKILENTLHHEKKHLSSRT